MLTNMLSKRDFKHFLFYGKVQRAIYFRLRGKKALQTRLITNAVFNIVTSLVEAWKPACVETSQYIKSHETVPTLQINYCIVEHVKKDNLCSYERKATYTGTAAFISYTCGYCARQTLYLLTSLG